jgi:tellurite resistance protein TerC
VRQLLDCHGDRADQPPCSVDGSRHSFLLEQCADQAYFPNVGNLIAKLSPNCIVALTDSGMQNGEVTVLANTQSSKFVDLDVPLWAWGALLGIIALMLAIDLFRHRDDHEPTQKEAFRESLVWVMCGLSFSVVILIAFGSQAWGEYLSGYVIEKSLSVDNVFVWAMLFSTMGIPLKYQHRVLFWGIFGALALRAIFIGLGSALISSFWWMLLIFGALLIGTGIKVLRHTADEGHDGSSGVMKLVGRFVPVSSDFDGSKFLTIQNGKKVATPLLGALIAIELTDVIFAVDSVPAILAVSHENYLVFASNAFAILGLRAMYFLLADAKERFHYLSHALGLILIFVGIKMTISHWYHMPTFISLGVIVVILAGGIFFSLRRPQDLHIHDEGHAGTHASPHASTADTKSDRG